MPCDSITTSTVNLANVDKDTLTEALRAAGWTVSPIDAGIYARDGAGSSFNWTPGRPAQLRTTRADITAASIARLYSAQVVRKTAQKNGWRLTETAPGQFLVQR